MSSWITSTWSRWPARSLAPRRSRGSLVRVDRFRVCMWRPVQDVGERADIYRFLTLATEQVCAAGLLPRPREELVPYGARVEVMRVGGKPPPPSRYHTGTVNGHQWDSVDRTWRVHVAFDQPAGTYYGQPVKGPAAFPHAGGCWALS